MVKKKSPPVKSILLAITLFLIGSLFLILGSLILTGYIAEGYRCEKWISNLICPYKSSDRGIPLIVLGSITFIPGAFYTRLAYYAWKGYRGYDYSLIPQYE